MDNEKLRLILHFAFSITIIMSSEDCHAIFLNGMHEKSKKWNSSVLSALLSRARIGSLKMACVLLLIIGIFNSLHFFHPLSNFSNNNSKKNEGVNVIHIGSRIYIDRATKQNEFNGGSKRIQSSERMITALKNELLPFKFKLSEGSRASNLNTTELILLNYFSLNDSRISENESNAVVSVKTSKVNEVDRIKQPDYSRQMNGQSLHKVRVAAINFARSDISMLEKSFENFGVVQVHVDTNRNLSWKAIYPSFLTGRIDPCPLSPPYSSYSQSELFDVVVVRAPCNASDASWAKNVSRHVLLLAAAEIAVNHTKGESSPVIVLSQCRPTPNLFICSELKEHKKNAWLFHVKRKDMQDRLTFPVGSCRLSTPLNKSTQDTTSTREAYATVLHSVDTYVCGAIVLAQSLKLTRTKRDLVLLHDNLIKHKDLQALKAAGWKLHEIERIQNPYAKPNSYNEWNYSKLRLWQLVQYEKIVFIDSDLLVLRNMDSLFSLPELSARSNGEPTLFNSGVMVIEPSMCTFRMIMSRVKDIVPYNGGDQGFLNEIFTWWHRIPDAMNFLKQFNQNNPNEVATKSKLIKMKPPSLYAIHYLGIKPWMCFRDYDCNWIYSPSLHQFANDEAHKLWWEYHDELSSNLQKFCWLNDEQKHVLLWNRERAQSMGYKDMHWNLTIKDNSLPLLS